jgi:hypothetical protein
VSASSAAELQELLGLSDDELCRTLDADPLMLLSGQLDHRPELPILLDLLAEAEERAGAPILRRWVRATASTPTGYPGAPPRAPIDALLARDFALFEDQLAVLAERGFVLRGGD